MKITAEHYLAIFRRAIDDYHISDDFNSPGHNPYHQENIEHLFYQKSWIDTAQWHIEDAIRVPDIDSDYAVLLKRRIDTLNQQRTDIVENIDYYFYEKYSNIVVSGSKRHNTESLGWAFDRLSILELKRYHTDVELSRYDVSEEHKTQCLERYQIILLQREDLLKAINWLVDDIENGHLNIKVYRQLKMYNDAALNPALYLRL